MRGFSLNRTGASRFYRAVVVVVVAWVAMLVTSPGYSQVSPEEHKKHHPGKTGPAPGGMAPGGMGEGMGDMMKGMGQAAPKEMYPALMSLPEMTVEKREEVQRQAGERLRAGASLWSMGLNRLTEAMDKGDYATMHEALAQVQEGVKQFESGLAAQRALAEGRAPRSVALQWFKQEMNLLSPGGEESGFRLWGMSAFHSAIMAGLVIFAGAMIALYYFKMQRAALLLQNLTGASPATGAAPAPAPSPAAAADQPLAASASPAATTTKWSGKLRVSRIFQETSDVKTFRLMNPLGGALPFNYLPGQFFTVSLLVNGKPVKRSYTIASSPTQHDYVECTVKHQAGGEVSDFLHSRVQEGDLLEFSGPSGSFTFTGRECKCILLIGGGVGITPLMSVLRYLTDRSWPGDIYLLYSCRTAQDIIFREELEYLQRRHQRLRVVITISSPEETDWKGPRGQITKELIAQSVPDLAGRYVHICGPVPLMEAVKKMLAELGLPRERVRTEAFGPALGKPEPAKPAAAPGAVAAAEKAASAALPTVTFARSDKSAPLPADKAILEVADEVGVEIDNSCRVGTCGTCRVKLLSGQVSMAVEDGLQPGDKEQGIILACQAKSTGQVEVEA